MGKTKDSPGFSQGKRKYPSVKKRSRRAAQKRRKM